MPSSLALLHRIDDITHALFLPAVLVALLFWLAGAFLMATGRRDWRPSPKLPEYYKLALGGFMAIVAFFIVTGAGIEQMALKNVREVLFARVTGVTVDGHAIADPQILIGDLRQLPTGSDHHSHPIKVFRVALQTVKGPLTLNLERDSGDPAEYWVYDPDFKKCFLGKIYTHTLDAL